MLIIPSEVQRRSVIGTVVVQNYFYICVLGYLAGKLWLKFISHKAFMDLNSRELMTEII